MARRHSTPTKKPPTERTRKQVRDERRADDPSVVPPPVDAVHVEVVAAIGRRAAPRSRAEREELFRALRDDLRRAAAGREDATSDEAFEAVLFHISLTLPRSHAVVAPGQASRRGGKRRAA